MANLRCLRTGILQLKSQMYVQCRTKVRYNVQRPRQPHYERHLMFELTKPIYPKDTRSRAEKCSEFLETQNNNSSELHPYFKLLAEMLRNDFDSHCTCAIYQRNPIAANDFMKARSLFKKKNLLLRHFDSDVVAHAIKDSKYQELIDLFHTDCTIAFGKDPIDAAPNFLKLEKIIPEFILLGGVIEDQIMSKSQIKSFSELPSLDVMRSQLSRTIGSQASKTSALLQSNQLNLAKNLDQYIKQNNS